MFVKYKYFYTITHPDDEIVAGVLLFADCDSLLFIKESFKMAIGVDCQLTVVFVVVKTCVPKEPKPSAKA